MAGSPGFAPPGARKNSIKLNERVRKDMPSSQDQGPGSFHFERLFLFAPVAMLTVDRNGVIVDANEIAGRLTGYPLSSLRDMEVDKLVPTISQDHHENLRDSFWNEENASRVMAENRDVSMLHADGTTRPVEVSLVRLSDENQDDLVLASLVDVTYRYKARSLLEEQTLKVLAIRDELETVLNAATSGIVAFDETGQILRINNHARHMLGGISTPTPFAWPKDISFLEADTLKPLDTSADPVRRALSGHILRGETHIMKRTQAGEDHRYVRMDSARVDGVQSSVYTVVVIDDVSDEERNRQVVERKGRLDALGQLTGGIAHDFNNLLASQLYSVNLARKAEDPDKRDSYLEIAEASIHRGRSLTSRLLTFARKQPGLSSVGQTAEMLVDFEKLVRPMLEAQIELTFEIEDDQMSHFCDQTQLETALMNLVLNSRDAILRDGKGSRIEIKARPVRAPVSDLDARQTGHDGQAEPGSSFRYVEITVTDNGPGMNAETLARCMDPFFTTKDNSSNSGLGLAMVFGFARQSDADLRIYSELNVGTTIQLTLPRGAEDGAREERMPELKAELGRGQTVLVVEDEPQLLMMLVETLKDLGYAVISAKSGPDAMEAVERGARFDLLMTDVVMPGAFGGFELARRVRAIHPDMPVIYTSGYTGFTAFEMGEVQAPLLQKPASPAELAEAISQALEGFRTNLDR